MTNKPEAALDEITKLSEEMGLYGARHSVGECLAWLDKHINGASVVSNDMYKSIKSHLTAQQDNTLPLELLADGWLLHKLEAKLGGGFYCSLDGPVFYAEGEATTTRQAMLNAIKAIGDVT